MKKNIRLLSLGLAVLTAGGMSTQSAAVDLQTVGNKLYNSAVTITNATSLVSSTGAFIGSSYKIAQDLCVCLPMYAKLSLAEYHAKNAHKNATTDEEKVALVALLMGIQHQKNCCIRSDYWHWLYAPIAAATMCTTFVNLFGHYFTPTAPAADAIMIKAAQPWFADAANVALLSA